MAGRLAVVHFERVGLARPAVGDDGRESGAGRCGGIPEEGRTVGEVPPVGLPRARCLLDALDAETPGQPDGPGSGVGIAMRLVGELGFASGGIGDRREDAALHGALKGLAVAARDGDRDRIAEARVSVEHRLCRDRGDERGVGRGVDGTVVVGVVVVSPTVDVTCLPRRRGAVVGERPGLRRGAAGGNGHPVQAQLPVRGHALREGDLPDERRAVGGEDADLRQAVAGRRRGLDPVEADDSAGEGNLLGIGRLLGRLLRVHHREGVSFRVVDGLGFDGGDVPGGRVGVDVGGLRDGRPSQPGTDDRRGIGHLPVRHLVDHRECVGVAVEGRLGDGGVVLEGHASAGGAGSDGADLP